MRSLVSSVVVAVVSALEPTGVYAQVSGCKGPLSFAPLQRDAERIARAVAREAEEKSYDATQVFQAFKSRLEAQVRPQLPPNDPLVVAVISLVPADVGRCFATLVPVMQEGVERGLERAQRRIAEQDRQRRIEEEKRTPRYLLQQSYAYYIHVKRCYDARSGYQLVFISEPEADRARDAVRAIEKFLKAADVSLDGDALWQKANESVDKVSLTREGCQASYRDLVGAYRRVDPSEAGTKKDF